MADRQDIDALIVGALYGEIDADERARLDAHLSSHPEDRAALEGLQRTRAEVRRGMAEMPAQEPSPLVSNVLMAAAREAANAGAKGAVEAPNDRRLAGRLAQTGLWSRFVEWMRPIAGHPAFAAAAVLVLVAGTASALWLRDKGKATEPEVARHAQAEHAPASPSGEAKMDEADGTTSGDLAKGEGYAALDQGAATGSAVAVAPTDGKDALAMERSAPSKGTAVGGKPARKKAASDPGMMQLEVRGDEVSIKELEDSGSAADSDDGDADKADGPSDRRTKSTGAGVATAPRPEPTPVDAALEEWAAGKHTQLAKLVADGKCPEAGRLGAQIKDRAPEYYAANVANDRAIRACKSYIEGQAKKKADKDYKSRAQTNTVDAESPSSN